MRRPPFTVRPARPDGLAAFGRVLFVAGLVAGVLLVLLASFSLLIPTPAAAASHPAPSALPIITAVVETSSSSYDHWYMVTLSNGDTVRVRRDLTTTVAPAPGQTRAYDAPWWRFGAVCFTDALGTTWWGNK